MPREKQEVVRITVPIRAAIHAELKIRARKDRRSTSNLINLILEKWVQEMKDHETVEEKFPLRKGGTND